MSFPWALKVTYADHENNVFLTLGGAAWKTKRERDRSLRNIPSAKQETEYLLDIESPRGIVDNRYIDAATVEALIGEPVPELIAKARLIEEARRKEFVDAHC